MVTINQDFVSEFQSELKRQLRDHRKKLDLTQAKVADAVGTSRENYQRWENTGQHLTDVFSLLSVFQALHFTTAEIIGILGLTELTLDEIKAIYSDEDTLESIKQNGIYSAMRKKFPDVEDFTLERLLVLLMEERLKRLGSRQKNL